MVPTPCGQWYWDGPLSTVIKLYLSEDVPKEEIEVLLSFLAAASDTAVQEELLQMLLSLLTTAVPARLGGVLWRCGLPLLVLIRAESMPVRLLTIKVTLNHLSYR